MPPDSQEIPLPSVIAHVPPWSEDASLQTLLGLTIPTLQGTPNLGSL
uniref:Uncharacterized protein n=1 Tax=Anguilla anguilla TaxID=7936 RepID=A0A0E9T5P0_ANGAN